MNKRDQRIDGLASDIAKQIAFDIAKQIASDIAKQIASDIARQLEPEIKARIVKVISDPDPRLGELFSSGASHPRAKPRAASAFSYDDVQTPKAANASPKACEMLSEMSEMLTTAPQLRSRPKLIDIADDLDVPLAKKDTMPRMAQKMLTAFADRDTEGIQTAFNLVKQEAERGTTASYMRLANGIMGNSGRDND